MEVQLQLISKWEKIRQPRLKKSNCLEHGASTTKRKMYLSTHIIFSSHKRKYTLTLIPNYFSIFNGHPLESKS